MHKVYKPGEYPEDYNYEEMCPHCDEQIAVVIDDNCYDYHTTCPVCGKPLMLCNLCRWDYTDGEPLTGYNKCGQNCYKDLARREECKRHYTQLRIDFAWDAGYDEDRLLKAISTALLEQGLDMLGHDVESMDHAYTEEVQR